LKPLPAKAEAPPRGYYTLPISLARILYTLVKIRGPKIISRFLPNQPSLLEDVTSLFSLPSTGVGESWELRYILLLWLSHLLLAPFDLSTISTDPPADVVRDLSILDDMGLNNDRLPNLSKRLLVLGITYLSSPGNRESDAAALLLIRISLRRDMKVLGSLDAMVDWGIRTMETVAVTADARALFLKTGVLAVLAGFLAQGDSDDVQKYVPRMFELVTRLQDQDCEEWKSAGVRRLGMKIFRWVATLVLAQPREVDYIEDIVERLLNALGDRDTAVRFGASKSLAVVARKLDPDMAGDVLEAVMGVYDEDVFFDPPIPKPGQRQKKMLTAVTPEKWHGATLTLATFLRQRAVRSTEVMTKVVQCIVEALSFEQRRSTFAVGGNVRDAACYAAWSLARSYTTDELQGAGDIVVPATQFEEGRKIIQLLATELVVAGCMDPLGNVRRAASAALQELVGRHSGYVMEGISLVQAVDYNAVALRQRSVISVAADSVTLGKEYWKGVVFGLVDGWRGIGSSDGEGRKFAATSLGKMVRVRYSSDDNYSIRKRGRFVFQAIMQRNKTEGMQHIEIYHGCLLALAEVLDGLPDVCLDAKDKATLHNDVFSKLKGHEFTNPVMRPELTAEATCRLVRSLAILTPSLLDPQSHSWKQWTAIIEASLDRPEDSVLDEAIPAARALLEKVSEKNRLTLVDSWNNKISALTYRRRGHILALGEVLAGIPNSNLDFQTVTDILVSAAGRTGEVEIRVAAVKALGRGNISSLQVIDIILESLDDYAVDTRGDVGSWVRGEAITALLSLWPQIPEKLKWTFISKLVRLSVEKLDRLRLRAGEALLAISTSFPIITVPQDMRSLSTEEYFSSLILLLSLQQCREALLEGYVTSAGAGSDSVLKASRRALITYLASSTDQAEIATSLVNVFHQALTAQNDRIVIPLLDVFSLLLDLQLLPGVGKKIFVQTQKAHYRTTSVQKLAAAIRVYRSLALAEPALRKDAVTKLVGMLLHPFPRIRMDVSEAVYLVALEGGDTVIARGLELVDWGKGTKELKSIVATLREGLC